MSLVSNVHALSNVSDSPGFVVLPGESDADAVAPLRSATAAIPSSEPALLPPNRREQAQDFDPYSSGGNASGAPSSERGNKPVWGRTPNGAIDAAPVVLGGSSSWPALSESAKASTKPSFDGSASALGPKSLPISNRGGGNSGDDVGTSGSFSSNGEPSSSSSTLSSAEMSSQNTADKKPDKDNHSNLDHRPHRWVDQGDRRRRHGVSSRRGSYGSRRDEDRVDWSSYRPPSVRDSHMQRSTPSLPVMRPHVPAMVPFFGPPPLFQHFPGPMAYPDIPPQLYFYPTQPHPEPFGGYPFVPHPAPPAIPQPIFFASAEQKRTLILKQIEYYFSPENLCRDSFLRSNMDNHGWVPINVIAKFNRIKLLTDSIPFILDAIRCSDVLEVEGNRIRKRDGWKIWILNPLQNQCNTESEPNSQATTNQESLVSQIENIALNEGNSQSS